MQIIRFADLCAQGLARGKRVFIRADLNVPFDDQGRISEDTRIRASVPAIQMALDAGAAVMVTSHLGRPTEGAFKPEDSLAPVAKRLAELLAFEFEVLKARDMAGFEALQEERITILERLSQVAQWAAGQDPVPVLWQNLQADLQQCKQDHLRNIQLLQRQLQAVKGALQALQGESAATVDLYDRLGQVSRRRGVSPFLDA